MEKARQVNSPMNRFTIVSMMEWCTADGLRLGSRPAEELEEGIIPENIHTTFDGSMDALLVVSMDRTKKVVKQGAP